jgi:putative ABC transport system permease protein
VLTEGLLIGLISYVISLMLSFPVSLGFVIGVGQAFFDRPLPLVIAPVGFVAWLAIAVILAIGASLVPAQRAAAISVREALAYE